MELGRDDAPRQDGATAGCRRHVGIHTKEQKTREERIYRPLDVTLVGQEAVQHLEARGSLEVAEAHVC